jgi:hypothetical protein
MVAKYFEFSLRCHHGENPLHEHLNIVNCYCDRSPIFVQLGRRVGSILILPTEGLILCSVP